MATREQRIRDANAKITTKLNTLKSEIGNVPGLSTTDKTSLVAAINETLGVAQAAAGGGVSINDSVTNLTQAWSSTKISSEITTAITAALEGEDLSDLADAISNLAVTDAGLVSALNTQSFTAPQQAQARTNIDAAHATEVGDTDYDFEADIDSALTF
ncbi:MAG: hypothetical protein AAF039_15105 [Bacteroidota bacterium]